MKLILLTVCLLFFWIGYKYGRKVEKWAQNHKNNGTLFNQKEDDE